jgi:hypothetical protein
MNELIKSNPTFIYADSTVYKRILGSANDHHLSLL